MKRTTRATVKGPRTTRAKRAAAAARKATARAAAPSIDSPEFHPLTPDRWGDLEALFGERGACGGCWCMAWRLKRADFDEGKGAANRTAFRKIVQQGPPPGVLAYVEGEPVGWCALAPRETYVTLANSRVLKPIDDQPVWSVSCFFVRRDLRGRGVGVALLRAACEFAAGQGARIVEGYPVEPTMKPMPAAFAWVGVPALFRKAGFREAKRASEARRIMRWTA